jgi:putative ABC transport system permease protein
MSMLRNYLTTAFNVYARRKLYTAINLACIVLTLVVLLVLTAILQNAFYPSGVEGKSPRFLQVTMLTMKTNDDQINAPLGYKVIDKYLRPMRSVASVAAVTNPAPVSVYQSTTVRELMLRRTDAQYWRILDFVVLEGRVISEADLEKGRFVAVLNESSARKIFPKMHAVGSQLNVAGQQFEVIGVVQDVMHLNAFADIWTPITSAPSSEYRQQIWGDFSALLLAKNAADIPAIKAEVLALTPRVAAEDPGQWQQAFLHADGKLDYFARELLGHREQPDSGATQLLLAIGAFMLIFMLLPALNLVNLNIGRIMERGVEIGVRKAFGASSNQLVAQLVVENILLSLLGGALALLLAKGVLVWLGSSGVIPYLQIQINFAVFALGLILTIVFGVLSGVVPAWKMSRLAPVVALKGVM